MLCTESLIHASMCGLGNCLMSEATVLLKLWCVGPHLKNFSHPPTLGEVMDVLMRKCDARLSLPSPLRIRPNLAVPKRCYMSAL